MLKVRITMSKINDLNINNAQGLPERAFGKENFARVNLTLLDLPFNQDKEYNSWNDNLPEDRYLQMMKNVCNAVF